MANKKYNYSVYDQFLHVRIANKIDMIAGSAKKKKKICRVTDLFLFDSPRSPNKLIIQK